MQCLRIVKVTERWFLKIYDPGRGNELLELRKWMNAAIRDVAGRQGRDDMLRQQRDGIYKILQFASYLPAAGSQKNDISSYLSRNIDHFWIAGNTDAR